MNSDNKPSAAQQLKTCQLLNFVFIASYLILGGVGFYLAQQQEPKELDVVGMTLLGMALAMILISIGARAQFLRILLASIPETERDADKVGTPFLVSFVISLALRESGVILAFVVSFLFHQPHFAMAAAMVAAVLNLLAPPKREQINEHLSIDKQL